jgi:hypothetical protein
MAPPASRGGSCQKYTRRLPLVMNSEGLFTLNFTASCGSPGGTRVVMVGRRVALGDARSDRSHTATWIEEQQKGMM